MKKHWPWPGCVHQVCFGKKENICIWAAGFPSNVRFRRSFTPIHIDWYGDTRPGCSWATGERAAPGKLISAAVVSLPNYSPPTPWTNVEAAAASSRIQRLLNSISGVSCVSVLCVCVWVMCSCMRASVGLKWGYECPWGYMEVLRNMASMQNSPPNVEIIIWKNASPSIF